MEKPVKVPIWLIILSAPIGFFLSILLGPARDLEIGYSIIFVIIVTLFGSACYRYAAEIKKNRIFAYFVGYCLNIVGWVFYHRYYRLTKEKKGKK